MEKVQVVSMVASLALLAVVLHLIRKRHLREQYSLLWLLFCLLLFALSLSTRFLESAASLLDIRYAPALLFLAGIVVCFILILHLTVVVSRLTERMIRLTQELGMTQHRLEESNKGAEV